MKTGIIIVTYNCLDMIRATLAHVKRNTPKDEYEIIIVDNNSEDGTKEYLREKKYLSVHLNVENTGYGLGNIKGVEIAKILGYERVILLNPDTMPHIGWFEALHKTMDDNCGDYFYCGIVGAKLLDYSDPDRIVHGGTYWHYKEGLHLTGKVSNGDYDEDKRMHWVTGAVMLIDLKCWDSCGGMPPFYFYGQDSMFCFMAWYHEWSVWYSAGCHVRHYEGYCMRKADQLVPEWKKRKQEEEGKEFKKLFAKYYREDY